MRRLEISPVDVLLFRDSRPFGGVGAAGHAGGLFPPPPSALYGAVRTAAFRSFGAILADGAPPQVPELARGTWGDADRHGSARLLGPVPWHDTLGALWPVPRSVLRGKSAADRDTIARALPLIRGAGIETSMGAPWRAVECTAPALMTAAAGYLDGAGLAAFLAGSDPRADSLHQESVVTVAEDRTGIARERSTSTVSEGALFTMAFRRLQLGAKLVAWLDGDDGARLPERGVMRLGHDGRLARWETRKPGAPGADWPAAPRVEGTRVFAYLATPALLRGGWIPSWVDPTTGSLADGSAKLVAASVAPYVLGGWDLARRQPRALRRYASAGSVYFFEAPDKSSAASLAERLHGKSISEGAGETGADEGAACMGFGLCFAGVW